MKVVFTRDAFLYMEALAHTLYINHYFGFPESAHKYVDDLDKDILTRLPSMPGKDAPPHYDKYGHGMYFAAFRKNKRTCWYVFFRKYRVDGEIVLQVRFIGNNHTESQYL